jgi:hypothetical protein
MNRLRIALVATRHYASCLSVSRHHTECKETHVWSLSATAGAAAVHATAAPVACECNSLSLTMQAVTLTRFPGNCYFVATFLLSLLLLGRYTGITASKPRDYCMYHTLQHPKTLHSAHRAYLYVPYGSHNKQRLFP